MRETAAQALAAALQATSLYSLQRVLELLACMYNHREWHVRHGAYTGIKYLLASRCAVQDSLHGKGGRCMCHVFWTCLAACDGGICG